VSTLNLEVVEGPNAGLQVAVDRPLVVGREETADVHLNDPRVSRRHARIAPADGEATIEDLGSANGTFVNHAQVHGSVRLGPGDQLLLGTSVMTLRTPQDVQARPSAVIAVPHALVAPERPPDYVQRGARQPAPPVAGPPQLTKLLDVRVRAQARLAPLAMLA
jgi:pSer/pThr/pTyr-binding forkhead associated (FHA) protein